MGSIPVRGIFCHEAPGVFLLGLLNRSFHRFCVGIFREGKNLPQFIQLRRGALADRRSWFHFQALGFRRLPLPGIGGEKPPRLAQHRRCDVHQIK